MTIHGTASQALAHSNYSSSTPAFGAILLPPAPTQVRAFFTQDLNLSGTNSLNVLGPAMNDVDNNDMVIDSGNHKHMTITLQGGLAFGTYTVQWTTTSAVDGHTGNGPFTFQYFATIGGDTTLADLGPATIVTETGHDGFSKYLAVALTGGVVFAGVTTLGLMRRRRRSALREP